MWERSILFGMGTKGKKGGVRIRLDGELDERYGEGKNRARTTPEDRARWFYKAKEVREENKGNYVRFETRRRELDAIEALALALLQSGRLTGLEVRQLVE